MNNHVINYQEACFPKIKYSFAISLKQQSAMRFHSTLLGFTMALFNWRYFLKKLLNRCCHSNIELDVHNVLTFSCGNDQYARFTNQKIATYAGQIYDTAEIFFQGLKC